ncbi:MAG TPA: AEC family transporter [Thermodesulfobacteriota bacterium]|nr:AEC family transporter [Thermodesulfobacteriota bacterium]
MPVAPDTLGLFTDVLGRVTLPMLALAAVGYGLQRPLALDVAPLNRLLVHGLLPAVLIHHLAAAPIGLATIGLTAFFAVAQFVVLLGLGWGVGALARQPPDVRALLGLAAAFPNTGNYGIPLVELAFGPAYLPHQAVIVALHTILITSLGAAVVAPGGLGLAAALRAALRVPLIPAAALGLLLKLLAIPLPAPLAYPLAAMAGAFAPLALLTLGAQLAASGTPGSPGALGLALLLRLLVGPAATWGAVTALRLPPDLADMLVVSASAPAGVLLAIVCAQYGAKPSLASAVVFVSTLLSPLTVTLAILAVRLG